MNKEKKTILLVEDEIITATVETRILEKNGFTVLIASTGEEAVDIALGTVGIDLILMDIDLGAGMDGPQAAEAILQKKSIPVLFLSSHTEPEIVEKTEKITSYGYVVKNTGETVLIASIGMAFKLYNANRTVEIKSEELTATNEELEATNEELQATMEELIGTNEELERLLAENKEAYKQLSEKEYFLHKSQEIAQLGSYISEYTDRNLKTNKITASPIFYEIFGLDDMTSLTSDFFTSLYLEPERVKEYYNHIILNKEKSYSYEYQVKRYNDGAIRWINTTGEITYDDEGYPLKIIGTSQDITERKLAEEALAKSEDFLQKSQEIARVGSHIREYQGNDYTKGTLYATETFYEIFGIDKTVLLESNYLMKLYLNPEEMAELYKTLLLEKKTSFTHEYKIRRHNDGAIRWIYSLGELVYDDQGNLLKIIGTSQDITERKLAEEALAKSEKKLKTIFDNSPSAIFLVDEETRHIVDANKGVEWIGWTREELIGKSSEIVINWSDTVKADEIKELLMQDGKITNYRMDIRKKDGSYANVLLTADFIQIDGKNHILTITTDITRLNETEKEIIQAKQELQEANDNLTSTNEQLEAASEELQATMEELIGTNEELERLLAEHKEALTQLSEKDYFLQKSQEIAQIGSTISEQPTKDFPDGRIYASPTFYEIFGINDSDILTNKFIMSLYLNPDEIAEYFKQILIEKKKSYTKEFQIRRYNDGSNRWIYSMGELVYDDQGNLTKIIGTSQDITERKLAEEAQAKSEYFLKKSQEIALIGTVVSGIPDAEDSHDSWWSSPSIDTIYGIDKTYPKTRESGARMLVDREKVLGYIGRQIAEQKKNFQLEYQIRRVNDGKLRWLNGMIEVIYNEQKIPVETITTVQDITDRKNAEEALAKSEKIFRSLFENTPVGIVFSEDRKIINVNKALADITGYSIEEMTGSSTRIFFPSDTDFDNTVSDYNNMIKKHDMGAVETQFKHKNGKSIDVMIYWSKINPQENPTAITTIIHDITDQKRYERELMESEEKFRNLINNIQGGVYRCDLEGTILYTTPASANLLGYSSVDEMIGKKVEEFHYDPENAGNEFEILEKQGVLANYESILKRQDNGEPVIVLASAHYFHDSEDNIIGIEGSFTDITDRKKTEKALQQALEEKQILLKELQHRIKNNLSMIINMIEIETTSEASPETTDRLLSLQRRMYSLSNLYEYLFRTEAITEVNLEVYLHSVVNSLAETYINQIKAIDINEQYDPIVTNTKDATAWGLILNELLTNTLKFSYPEAKNGKITISLTSTKTAVSLKISDNGKGPPPDFDIHKSTGFGLQIVNALINQLGGTLSFRRGKENRFIIKVPIVKV